MIQVGRWDRFEISLNNPAAGSQAELNVTYKKPDGGSVNFWGFYDGDDVWKIRFMPDCLGVWEYSAQFSDGSPGASGQFVCVPSDIPGMISKDEANPVWFGFRGGTHVLVRSFHIGDCFFADTDNTVTGERWNPDMRMAFLDWAQKQGYKMLSVASHYLNRQSEDRGLGWQTPDLWDAASQAPNPEAYRKMERILDDLAARQMMVYPFAGLFGRDANFPRDEDRQDVYIRYTLARLAPYWNLLFMVGGPEPHLKSKPYLSHDEINRLGNLIRSLDPFGHLLSVHNPTGDDYFRQEPWVSYVTLQGPKTLDRAELGEDHLRNHHPEKPLYAQETLWPGNILHIRRCGRDYGDDGIRKNAYVMMMSAAAINFADMDGLSSSGFSGRPDLELRTQSRHDIIRKVWDFFETIPFYRMTPRQDLVDNGSCLADDGHRVLVYLESRGVVKVSLDGNFKAEWINAQDTLDRRDGGVVSSGQGLKTPEDGDDWLLELMRVDAPDQVHLSWTEDASESLTVTWHTASERNSATVCYRRPGETAWQEASGETLPSPGEGFLHRVALNGLSPSTVYDYCVSADEGVRPTVGPVYRSRTAPPPGAADFTFAFICDTGLVGRPDGNTTGTRQIIGEVLRDNPLFILGGGDYAYGNKDGRFEQMGDAIDTWFLQWRDVLCRCPFMAQYGNHEIHLVETYEDWAPRFAHPEGFDGQKNYAFDVGDVHFTALFVPSKNLTDGQLAWLDTDLASARRRDARWLVVYQHESMYGHGTSHPARPENRMALAPILEKHRVDLHLSCHDQNYERTFPLTGVPDNPTPGSADPHNYTVGQGVIYAKISPCGKMSEIGNQFSQFTTEQQPFMAVRDCTAHHYALVHVRRQGKVQMDVFSVVGDGTPRTLLDTFTISA